MKTVVRHITDRDWRVLTELRSSEAGLTIDEIAARLYPTRWARTRKSVNGQGADRGRVQDSVDRLLNLEFATFKLEHGLDTANPDDARGLVVNVTDKGRTYAQRTASYWRGIR